jgi:hypothetical protein
MMPSSFKPFLYASGALLLTTLAMPVQSASAVPLRVEIGGGYTQGDTSGSFAGSLAGINATVKADGLGGNGVSENGAVWADGLLTAWGFPDISYGLQYIHYMNSAAIGGSASLSGTTTLGPVSVALSGPPATVSTNLDFNINVGMFNTEWRHSRGSIHPYFGVGFGEAWTDVSARINANVNDTLTFKTTGGPLPAPFDSIVLPAQSTTTPVTITTNTPFGFSNNSFAAQFFLGTDIDIAPHWYAGAGASLLVEGSTLSNLVGANSALHDNTRQLSVFAHVGWYLN